MRATERDDQMTRDSVIHRVAAVLDVVAAGAPGIGISTVAHRTGLPKSTAQRLLNALVSTGLLERVDTSYRLGIKTFELGQQVPRGRDLRMAAGPYMADLREATKNTVHLAVLDGSDVVYLEILRGPQAPALPTRVGGRWPAHATGVGKAILAFSGPEALEAVVVNGLSRLSERTITAPGMLAADLQRTRDRGVAIDVEESRTGLVCTACPVFGSQGEVVAAMSVSGWLNTMHVDHTAAAVRTAALALSRELAC